jgi:hypothetical protein
MKWKIIGISISLVSFFIFAELFSLFWYYFSNKGDLFYFSRRPQLAVIGSETGNLLTETRFHPFFGWVDQPSETTNNHGFASPYNYPWRKSNQNQFIIGIFGGSVAKIFSETGTARLIQALKQEPFFANREIIILNFSAGGYKQPQQLLILNYYLTIGQKFDLVINIDGFNEVALSTINAQNQIDIAMPSFHHMDPMINIVDQTTLTGEKIELLARLNQNRTKANRLVKTMDQTSLASVYFISKQFYKIFFDQYNEDRLKLQTLEAAPSQETMIYVYPSSRKKLRPVVFEQMARQWLAASITMRDILQSRRTPYIHILQPNQYYSKKPFTSEEAAIVLRPNHRYRLGAEQGYPALIAYGERLKKKGVNFYSAVDIFDDEAEILYVDDCCHFNQTGNNLLADFISQAILTTESFK